MEEIFYVILFVIGMYFLVRYFIACYQVQAEYNRQRHRRHYWALKRNEESIQRSRRSEGRDNK